LQPSELQIDLLFTIFRTARVARFVRSRTVCKTSSDVNWYWLTDRLNPLWHWGNYREERRLDALEDQQAAAGGESSGRRSKKKKKSGISWGVLQLGLLAAVKAQMEMEAREALEAAGVWGYIKTTTKRALKYMGFMGDGQSEVRRRTISATKIQRAWRAHLEYQRETGSHDGENIATEIDGSRNNHINNPLGRKSVIKRSMRSSTSSEQDSKGGGRRASRQMSTRRMAGRRSSIQYDSQAGQKREFQVGNDMRELTGQRAALLVLWALVLTVIFTFTEADTTRPTTMIVLHTQTKFEDFQMDALYAARNTSTRDLYKYTLADGTTVKLPLDGNDSKELRDREKLVITVTDANQTTTVGWFAFRNERVQEAWTEFVATCFILLIWFFGVSAFAGPIMSLVIIPIERMVRLLGMLMLDPLGYQSTARFKKFLSEEDALINNTKWTKEVLRGMETSFLMSTILRIGSLMKVGFGSAGVEIIRSNLQKTGTGGRNMLNLTSEGIIVSCIFLFCDIRQFTDATESLQEEVFVFTNKIAAVVHSICHSYGGAANKNVGDAFLLSWKLDDGVPETTRGGSGRPIRETSQSKESFTASSSQADKALLSVIKIIMALHFDKYYIEAMSDAARTRLQNKLKNRSGPLVQMGCGLHAGKAVQGAIGSQRKIDATYVSEAVERAEFLESSTKQYGVKVLMSESFHRLLHPNTRRRCRKVDQLILQDHEGDEGDDDCDQEIQGQIMEIFTFDMDIDALWKPSMKSKLAEDSLSEMGGSQNKSASMNRRERGAMRQPSSRHMRRRRISGAEDDTKSSYAGSQREGLSSPDAAVSINGSIMSNYLADDNFQVPTELLLPTGPSLYSHNVWQTPEMKRIREKFVQGLFFSKFNSGLKDFYSKDWKSASQCFKTILDNFEDGPSRYFMTQIEENKGVPPKNFGKYGLA
jgi:class 3 adenylate cyclase